MKRAATVVLIAVLTAAISGINDTSWARQSQGTESEAHRRDIAARLAGIPIGSAIEVEPRLGRKFQAVLEDVTPNAMTVRLASGNNAVTRTIPLIEVQSVKRIRRIGSSTARKVLIGVGITAAVVVGTCAAALASAGD